jgi:hypothetical protein
LSERLHSVTVRFDCLRSMRFQDAITRAMPRKKIQKKQEIKPADSSKSNLVLKSDVSKLGDQEVPTAPMRVQEQLLDDETRALQVVIGRVINRALVKASIFYFKVSCLTCILALRWSCQVFLMLYKKLRQRWWRCQHLIILCQHMFCNKLNRLVFI